MGRPNIKAWPRVAVGTPQHASSSTRLPASECCWCECCSATNTGKWPGKSRRRRLQKKRGEDEAKEAAEAAERTHAAAMAAAEPQRRLQWRLQWRLQRL